MHILSRHFPQTLVNFGKLFYLVEHPWWEWEAFKSRYCVLFIATKPVSSKELLLTVTVMVVECQKSAEGRMIYLFIQLCVLRSCVSKCWVQTIVSVWSKSLSLEAVKGDIFYSLLLPHIVKTNQLTQL